MKSTLIKAETRGHANHGWLDTHHTFSFADYYDPNRIHFGALRVLNDDIVIGGEGFGKHPHDNMEIITIPLEGGVRHGDSMGNDGVIRAGEVQVMSAGKGVIHSEYNADKDQSVNFFQIWIYPNQKDVPPRYEQKTMDFLSHRNKLSEIVSPKETPHGLWIYQNAWLNIGAFDAEKTFEYALHDKQNGIFLMNIEGSFEAEGFRLDKRDGLCLSDIEKTTIKALSNDSRILIIEVPMVW
ncbi:MAG: pirin family protein [Bacteroidales bacterium]|jgi:redox-sensitive bicupin YhaK (pirin superfamily)|nr:pirin family protein [Bacteroidales bacterium]